MEAIRDAFKQRADPSAVLQPPEKLRITSRGIECPSAGVVELVVSAGEEPIQVEGLYCGEQWKVLNHVSVPERNGESLRIYLPFVPVLEIPLPDQWQDEPELELAAWREAHTEQLFELEMAMASAKMRRLLVQNKYLRADAPMLVAWPSRDRHQLWAVLWLALRLCPGRVYSESEVLCMLALHYKGATMSLLAAMKADLERRALVTPAEEGGLKLNIKQLQFVLDGDKLFALRACVASSRPWWDLPIAAQSVMAPKPLSQPPVASSFRCVLLDTNLLANTNTADAQELESFANDFGCSVKFVVSGMPPVDTADCSSCRDADATFVAYECHFAEAKLLLEVVCTMSSGSERLPPFRIEAQAGGEQGYWRMVQCQPMPTLEEMCNHGRGAVRCFIPHAVPVAELSDAQIYKASSLATLLENSMLKRWPAKQKQQRLACLWYAAHMLPGRNYSEAEVDWLIASFHTRASVPDYPTIRKELERTGFVERQMGGCGFSVKHDAVALAFSAMS